MRDSMTIEEKIIEYICQKKKDYCKTFSDEKKVFVIAIDGRSAAGKTTLAGVLGEYFQTDVIHMDDFFVPLPLRTKERYEKPGANVHYERFSIEVLPHLRSTEAFEYGFFDCNVMDINGTKTIRQSSIRIIEGAYSMHPIFNDYADLKIFVDVLPSVQMDRIIKRNGVSKAERFKDEWIPLEEEYLSAYDIRNLTDIIVDFETKNLMIGLEE